MEPFIVGIDITSTKDLFGRNREIETLISCAKRKGNAGIIGARRFGKTCLMKSLETYLVNNSSIGAYPLYFDVKTQCGIKKNTPAVYRSMASLLASKMCLDNLLPEGELKISRRCSLDISCDELDMRVQMEEWNPEYQKQVLFTLANSLAKNNKYLLLLLDEIDYLLLEAFDTPSDFSRIRGAATSPESNLKFWIAGTSTWSAICTSVGSPELNCGLENVTITPTSKEDFTSLWQHECSLIKETFLRQQYLDLLSPLFQKTGGVPYYAKFVASHMYTNKKVALPEYDVIRDYLCEIINNRFVSEAERSTMFLLSKGPKNFEGTIPDGITSLRSKGLVNSISESTFYLPIGYLEDYLRACSHDKEVVDVDSIEQEELNELVGQIERLRVGVNKRYINVHEVFIPSHEDPIEFGILRKRCYDEASMDAFSGSLYKLYYEGSNNGNNLPDRWSEFANLTRALRHLYNHRECDPSTMSEERLLMIVNNGSRPIYDYEFAKMQVKVLQLCRDELCGMQAPTSPSRTNTNTSTTESDSSSVLRGKINGDRNRIFVDNHPVYIIDNRKGFAPNNSPREYDYSEREEVLFELRERTNPKTGKPISFAINVRPAND